MDFLGLPAELEPVKNLLSTAAQANLTNYLVVVAIIWKVMGKRIAGHFASMEQSVKLVASEVSELRKAVTADLQMQSSRLEVVENGVVELKTRVSKLEHSGD